MGAIAWLGFIVALAVLGLSTWPVAFWYGVYKLEKPRHTVLARGLGGRGGVQLRRYDPFLVAEVTVTGPDVGSVLSAGFQAIVGYVFGNNTKQECLGFVDGGAAGGGGARRGIWGGPVPTPEIGALCALGALGNASMAMQMTSPVRLQGAFDDPLPQATSTTAPSKTEDQVKVILPKRRKSKWVEDFFGKDEKEALHMKVSLMLPAAAAAAGGGRGPPRPADPAVALRTVEGHDAAVVGFSGKCPSAAEVRARAAELRAAARAAGLRPAGPAVLSQYHPRAAPGIVRLNEVAIPVVAMVPGEEEAHFDPTTFVPFGHSLPPAATTVGES